MEDLPDGPYKWEVFNLHKSLGVLALLLGAWRVVWRIVQGFPEHVDGVLAWEKKAAVIAHYVLLVCIILMPLSGYIYSETGGYSVSFFGLFNLPSLPDSEYVSKIAKSIHGGGSNVLMITLLLHIGAALKHHFVNKDSTLKRMLGRTG